MDVVALVAKNAAIPINETNTRLGRNDSFESCLCDWHLNSPVYRRMTSPVGPAKFTRVESFILQNSASLWAQMRAYREDRGSSATYVFFVSSLQVVSVKVGKTGRIGALRGN